MTNSLEGNLRFQEAKALYRMVGDQKTVEELRELIAVPQK